MRFSKHVVVLAAAGGAAALTAVALAAVTDPGSLTNVPANPKINGFTQPNILSPQLQEVLWAQGSYKLDGGTTAVPYYGYDDPGTKPLVAIGNSVEAQKTEPDKNTYLVFKNGLKGPDPGYDYGTHYLFQGHETGNPGYITRINLDADGKHRVSLLATQTDQGVDLKTIDGSGWDPFAAKLLFTTESGSVSSVYQATPDAPSQVQDISNATGRGAFEGIQSDDRGNLYLLEDSGGKTGAPVPSSDPTFSTFPNAFTKQPNSFVYRFVPADPSDLTKGGKMQVLQVLVDGNPVTFTMPASSSAADVAAAANTDISGSNSAGYKAIHVYGATYDTKWITVNTSTSSTALPGADDNALAKSVGGTPFKRPENGVFRPGSSFKEFYFDETGDTDNRTCGGGGAAPNPNWAACTSPDQTGGFGSIFKLVQSPTSDTGSISLVYNGDQLHAGFDNVAFFSRDDVAFVEDAGDTLHKQRNALDSAYMFDVTTNYSNSANQPTRFIAEGRDASATLDAGLADAATPTVNEGDNEITGIYVSDGDPSTQGLLGKAIPKPFQPDGTWRAFWTQQHGDNNTWELIPSDGGKGKG
jgi:hypothetical protein